MKNTTTKARQHYNLQDLFARAKRAENGCIEWQMSTNQDGYGRLQVQGKVQQVTRLVLKLVTKSDGIGLLALHTCDNPPCINPDHLRWGTQLENMRDAVDRNRKPTVNGESNPRSKLTENDVLWIRSLEKPSALRLAEHYGLAHTAIYNILKGKSWQHLLDKSNK